MIQVLAGGARASIRSTVCCKSERSPARLRNCFGFFCRLRGQKRAARTDHHVKTTVAHCLPHVKVFAQGQAAVHDCDSPGEAFRKPAYGLRRERYLRYENDRSLPEGHRLIQRSQVYLRLAAACDAVEQESGRLS